MIKHILATVLLAGLISGNALSQERESEYYFKLSGGVSQPYLRNLSDELAAQGRDGLSPGYCAAVSLGRSLMEGKWSFEIGMNLSRYPSFRYENEFQDFSGTIVHYGFAVIAKRCLRPGKESLVPYVGVGIGYGKTQLSGEAGKLDGPEAIILLQLEHRVGQYIDIMAESVWTPLILNERYSSPFTVESDYDGIIDRYERDMNDGFSSIELRIGIKVWLKPPRKY
ncbi:MAG: hypothetical protein JW814_00550 [Candidatus Krumholzibacteriota bacterium]|nr:hypothetical protein [Candidatus Krumholzibacteriota bacterium]